MLFFLYFLPVLKVVFISKTFLTLICKYYQDLFDSKSKMKEKKGLYWPFYGGKVTVLSFA